MNTTFDIISENQQVTDPNQVFTEMGMWDKAKSLGKKIIADINPPKDYIEGEVLPNIPDKQLLQKMKEAYNFPANDEVRIQFVQWLKQHGAID